MSVENRVATILRHLEGGDFFSKPSWQPSSSTKDPSGVIIIGGAVLDITCRPDAELRDHTSNPASITLSWGGVGRNITEALHRLGAQVKLISVVGDDLLGLDFFSHSKTLGICADLVSVRPSPSRTAAYVSNHHLNGELVHAYADMDIFRELTPSHVLSFSDHIRSSRLILLDANLPEETLLAISSFCQNSGVDAWYECVSIPKSMKIVKSLHNLAFLSGNEQEIETISSSLEFPQEQGERHLLFTDPLIPQSKRKAVSDAKKIIEKGNLIAVFVTLGSTGSFVLYDPSRLASSSLLQVSSCPQPTSSNKMRTEKTPPFMCRFVPAVPVEKIISVSGAGDSFLGGLVAGLLKGLSFEISLRHGTNCAACSLQSSSAISPQLDSLSF